MTDKQMNKLDQLLADARACEMPERLSARILVDADQVQAAILAPAITAHAPVSPSLWRQLLSVLGGWPTLSGLVTAGVSGVWLGLAPPSFLPDPVQLVMGQGEYLDLMDMGALGDAVSEDG